MVQFTLFCTHSRPSSCRSRESSAHWTESALTVTMVARFGARGSCRSRVLPFLNPPPLSLLHALLSFSATNPGAGLSYPLPFSDSLRHRGALVRILAIAFPSAGIPTLSKTTRLAVRCCCRGKTRLLPKRFPL